MQETFVESATAIVKIIAEKENFSAIFKDEFFYSYIPSAVIKENSETFDATIKVIKSEENNIDLSYPNIVLYYKQALNSKDLIALTEYVLERARQEKGIICVHGAGAVIDGKMVTCWGPATGMGKTTLALELSKDGNEFYSDEKVLVDIINGKAVGRIKNQYISNDYWRNKFGNQKYFEHSNIADDIPYPIAMFVQALICNQEEYTLDIWTPEKFVWLLYEESSRKIRGTSRTFFKNSYPVMSLDTQLLATKRLSLLKEFTKKIPAIYYKGKAEKVVDYIKEKIK